MGVLESASARRLDGSAPTSERRSQGREGEHRDDGRRGSRDGRREVGGVEAGFRRREGGATCLDDGGAPGGVDRPEDGDPDGPADLGGRGRQTRTDARVSAAMPSAITRVVGVKLNATPAAARRSAGSTRSTYESPLSTVPSRRCATTRRKSPRTTTRCGPSLFSALGRRRMLTANPPATSGAWRDRRCRGRTRGPAAGAGRRARSRRCGHRRREGSRPPRR